MKAAARFYSLLIPLLAVIFLPSSLCADTIKVKNPGALPVLDNAHILTQAQISDLNVRLRTLADTDGTQVVVLTVPTTGDEDIFTFAQRTATEWGIGQKKNSNGVLFTVAVKDRKTNIHVGYGLEGWLTDALSKRIIETDVLPRFKEGNYYAGISKGVDDIIAAVKGEYKAPPPRKDDGGGWIEMLVVLGIFVLIVYMANRGGGGRGGGGGGGRGRRGGLLAPLIWTTGGGSLGGWGAGGGSSGGGPGGGGGFGGGFGGGGFGGGGASGGW